LKHTLNDLAGIIEKNLPLLPLYDKTGNFTQKLPSSEAIL